MYDHAGYALDGGRDADGDGSEDYFIGAYGDDDAGSTSGAAYVVYGAVSGTISLASADVKIVGESSSDWFGHQLISPGDLNDDGYADLVVGAPEYGTYGLVYVFLAPFPASIAAGSADATIQATGLLGNREDSCMSGGDVNGDGRADLLLGSSLNNDTAAAAGAAWLLYGPITGSHAMSTDGDPDARFLGAAAGDHLGISCTIESDLDGDGQNEVVVGAPGALDAAGTASGLVYIFRGG